MAKISSIYTLDKAFQYLLFHKFNQHLELNAYSPIEDEAINKSVVIYPKEIAQREIAEKRGETSLNFINLWKNKITFSWERNRSVMARVGLDIPLETNSVNIKAIPIDIDYTFWMWSKDLDKINCAIEEFLFWIHTYPKLTLTLNDKFPLEYDLHFPSVVDVSPVSLKYQAGVYFCIECLTRIDGWLFKLLNQPFFNKIVVEYHDNTNVEKQFLTTIYVEDSNYNPELDEATFLDKNRLYKISSVNIEENSIYIDGDFEEDFEIEMKIKIFNSSNHGVYEIESVSYINGQTKIKLVESLFDTSIGIFSVVE